MSHTKAKDVVEKKHRAWGMPSDEPTNFPTEDELRKFVDEINVAQCMEVFYITKRRTICITKA